MLKARALAVLALFLLVGAVAATVYTQNITDTITLTGQTNDWFQGITDTIANITAQGKDAFTSITETFCGGLLPEPNGWLADLNENVGTLQGNHTTGQTLGPPSAGNYSQTITHPISTGADPNPCVIIINVTIVVACNWFQLQCWWFPTLMLVLFLAIPLGAVIKGGAERRGIAYISLVSLTFASGIEVLMGVMDVTMPIMLTIAAALYAWRVL